MPVIYIQCSASVKSFLQVERSQEVDEIWQEVVDNSGCNTAMRFGEMNER